MTWSRVILVAYQRIQSQSFLRLANPLSIIYRSVACALKYLTFTHPKIAFAVHQVCLSCMTLVIFKP
ncbi:hypothetical protein HanIR_Chr02g0089371 [Helianthus annuus]|nr:hypothetical protein HanIR_Chr02g0089371 [Helianthus annuus]